MVGMTSWHMLVGRAKIKPGQVVLIMGGGSGVGMVGIQIAKLCNCTVIATAGNKDKMDKCMELEPTIPSTTEKPTGRKYAK